MRDQEGRGLFIARGVVVAHGGRIEIASGHEPGTTVRISIPQHAEPVAAPGPAEQPALH